MKLFALVNLESQDVLRTSAHEDVLMSIAHQMNALSSSQRYTVLGANRDEMNAALFERARECDRQQQARGGPHTRLAETRLREARI